MKRHFVFHGTFLILVGILSVMYNPHSGLLGFNPDAKSGLIVSGAFALISFFWAFIYSRQAHRVAVIGGFITTILLFAGTIPRAFSAWTGYAAGEAAKWFAATTISLVVIGSIPLFASLCRNLRANTSASVPSPK
jgi:hypothetical protein